ncbi:unnamed protein product [Brassica oleracea var. botrytis]|uniref:(rape) hypothetical protein n=1 Tax=Brassica napus TaxID=3708 RepID=A0A816J9M3_BRANA|nr:unnamed protein product [Brassica napus]
MKITLFVWDFNFVVLLGSCVKPTFACNLNLLIGLNQQSCWVDKKKSNMF